MLLGQYQFSCTLLDEALLPPVKSSTLRGAFGHALREVICSTQDLDCSNCPEADPCLYARTFFSGMGRLDGGGKRWHPPPHPFVIEPPCDTDTRYPPGGVLDFSLLIFGDTNYRFPEFVRTFEAMGRCGIGKKRSGRRARFTLTDIKEAGRPIFDPLTRQLLTSPTPEQLFLEPLPDPAYGRLTVYLRSPLRLKFENRLQAELRFHVLVRAMLRRIANLFEAYGGGEPALDYRGLVARAAAVEPLSSELRWVDWQLYSTRQEQKMLMGGLLGNITYHGQLTEFLPLVKLCSLLHLGKQTTFGLGKIDFGWEEEED